VTVKDVLNSNKRINDDWSLEGYQIPTYNNCFEKPRAVKIFQSK
jgi:hypothetical protein